MKNQLASLALLCAVCGLTMHSLAEQAPERRPEGREGRPNAAPGEATRPEAGRDAGGAGPRFEGGAPGRPEGVRVRLPEGVTPEMVRRYMADRNQLATSGGQLDAMRNYLDVFDRYSRLSRDPAAAGVAAVVTAGEILRARGADTAIAYFNKLMPDVKNDAVQRAIRLQLIELYKMSGQQDKALEQLTSLITSAPAGGTMTTAPEEGAGRARPQQ